MYSSTVCRKDCLSHSIKHNPGFSSMLPTGIQFMKSNIRGPGAHLVERIAFLTVPFLSRLCFVLMLSGKYISDLYERNTGIQTQLISQINTSESFVNRYLTPTHTNYSPENQTNTHMV